MMEAPVAKGNGLADEVPEASTTAVPAPNGSTAAATGTADANPPPPVAADAIDEKLIKVSACTNKTPPFARHFRRKLHSASCMLRRLPFHAALCPLQEFYNDMKSVDRDNEVNRILGAFRLNPFEQLGVRFDATPEEIRRQYRKVSTRVTIKGHVDHAHDRLHAIVRPCLLPHVLKLTLGEMRCDAGVADGAPG